MSISMAIFTFINVWWVTLFATLPLCIERGAHENAMDYVAAPKKIHWRRIVKLNTLMAIIVTALLAIVIKTGIVPVR